MKKVFGSVLVFLAILMVVTTSLQYYHENIKYKSLRRQRQEAIKLKIASGLLKRDNYEEDIDLDILGVEVSFMIFKFSLGLGLVMSGVGLFLILRKSRK